MKKVVAVLLIASFTTSILLPQTSSTSACAQAQMDAENDINGTIWFGAGCLLGLIGWGAAYVVKPSPPATRLVGKSPEYVAQYTDCYIEAGKKIQTKKAMNGCLTYAGVYLLLNVLLLSSAQ